VILADPTSYRGLVLCQLWHTASRQIVISAIPIGKTAALGPTVTLTITHGIRARARQLGQSNHDLTIDRP
jgi:hypothetical protein